jgi:hypothetical protein
MAGQKPQKEKASKAKAKPKQELLKTDDLAEGELDTVEESIKRHEEKKDQNS